MRKIKVEDAVGETLCHDMTGISGEKKGVAFSRGHTIRPEDIQGLLDIGKSHIYVWEPGIDEVHEDDAAIAVAESVCGGNIDWDKKPSEGKILMRSEIRGLFRVNTEALKRINSVPDYTIASLPNNTDILESGTKLGGIRIVPLVTKRENVEKAVKVSRENYPVFEVLPYKSLRCGVIITGSEVYYGRIADKFEPIMRKKLERFGGVVTEVIKCPDELETIVGAIEKEMYTGADLILLTGGMSVDPDDLTPTAIRTSGAEVITQGVPMQPGNMLMPAYLDETLLIGVPGASMHSKVTSLDVFLPKIFAGIRITQDEIPGLGDGGFCSGCEVCTYPRCYFGR